jgi:Staphylococcal nuclease homologue
MMASKGRVLLWSAAFVLLWAAPTHAADFSGHVVGILDGDTIEVLHTQRAEPIRLSGIDCPEKGQAYGTRAKQAASDLAFGKDVTLQTHGHDKYGRTLADVFLSDGTNVNHTLVKDCWCWWYRKYAPDGVDRGLADALLCDRGEGGIIHGLDDYRGTVLDGIGREYRDWCAMVFPAQAPGDAGALDQRNCVAGAAVLCMGHTDWYSGCFDVPGYETGRVVGFGPAFTGT